MRGSETLSAVRAQRPTGAARQRGQALLLVSSRDGRVPSDGGEDRGQASGASGWHELWDPSFAGYQLPHERRRVPSLSARGRASAGPQWAGSHSGSSCRPPVPPSPSPSPSPPPIPSLFPLSHSPSLPPSSPSASSFPPSLFCSSSRPPLRARMLQGLRASALGLSSRVWPC